MGFLIWKLFLISHIEYFLYTKESSNLEPFSSEHVAAKFQLFEVKRGHKLPITTYILVEDGNTRKWFVRAVTAYLLVYFNLK